MAVKPETTFSRGVMNHLPREVYHMKNNNPYIGGIPDIWISGAANDLWAEVKYIPRNPQRGVVSPVKLLSPLQAKWLRERHAEGRSVCVIIGCPAGGIVLPGITWEVDIPVKDFTAQVISRKAVAEWILAQVHQPTTR